MHIANPIYDVVFKYLMEDSKIAKLMISSIIGETIEELTFLPQELIFDINSKKQPSTSDLNRIFKSQLTVYRLDFSAKIKTIEGYKNVIIELQKAKFPTDIMRFRSYLGSQFSNKENVQHVRVGNKSRKTGIPIVSIYFLGHKLDNTAAGAIKISRQYHDLITGEIIKTKESFIESLTLDSYIIQIPQLTQKRRNDLEILLSIFDQSNPADNEHHILNINEKDFSSKYAPIIRKLQTAYQDAKIKKTMELEDGLLDEMQEKEREIEEKEQIIVAKDKVIEEDRKKLEEKDKKLEEKDKKLEEEKLKIEQLLKEIEKLKNS